jgi:hypothetical protein
MRGTTTARTAAAAKAAAAIERGEAVRVEAFRAGAANRPKALAALLILLALLGCAPIANAPAAAPDQQGGSDSGRSGGGGEGGGGGGGGMM